MRLRHATKAETAIGVPASSSGSPSFRLPNLHSHMSFTAANTRAGLHAEHPGASDLESLFLALTGRRLRD